MIVRRCIREYNLLEKLHKKGFLSSKGKKELTRLFNRALNIKKIKGDKKKELIKKFNKFLKTKKLILRTIRG